MQSAIGTVGFGALAGGVGSSLTGGNFWQGALIGGVVTGLNHAMHLGDSSISDNDDEYLLNKDGSTTKIGNKGGDTTDYLYTPESTGSPKLSLLATADVQISFATASEGGGTRDFGVNILLDSRLQSPAMYDPSFDLMSTFAGAGSTIKSLGSFSYKFMRGAGGKINGFSIGTRPGYGAQPRLDFHKLTNTMKSRATSRMTIPKALDGKKLLHYHRGKGRNLKYHRPWEIGPDGRRRW